MQFLHGTKEPSWNLKRKIIVALQNIEDIYAKLDQINCLVIFPYIYQTVCGNEL